MTPFGSICSRALGVQMLKKATSGIKDASMSLVVFFVCLIVCLFFKSLVLLPQKSNQLVIVQPGTDPRSYSGKFHIAHAHSGYLPGDERLMHDGGDVLY